MSVMIRMMTVLHDDTNLLAAYRVYLNAVTWRRTPLGEPGRSSPGPAIISAVGAEQQKGPAGSDVLLSRGLFSLHREAGSRLLSNTVFEYGMFEVKQLAIASLRRSQCAQRRRGGSESRSEWELGGKITSSFVQYIEEGKSYDFHTTFIWVINVD